MSKLFGSGLSITASILASQGFGKLDAMTIAQAEVLMKSSYASELQYISAIGLAKLSLLVIFHNISGMQRWHRRFVLGLGIFILLWSSASILAVTFQCEFPQPRQMSTSRCFNIVSTHSDIHPWRMNVNRFSVFSGSCVALSTCPQNSLL